MKDVTPNFEDRFKKHLPRSKDLTLIVLKGHLLLEEVINLWLTQLLKNPSALNLSELSFSKRLCLLRSLLPDGSFSDAFKATEKLNVLRNKLAHHLDHPKIESLINDFVGVLEDPDTPIEEYQREPVHKRLKSCISFLCGQLYGAQEAFQIVKE